MVNKHMKKYSTPSAIREMQIKLYEIPSTLVRLAIIKKMHGSQFWQGCEENRTLVAVGWNVVIQSLWKQQGELSLDPPIPLLVVYPKETKSHSKRHLPTLVYCGTIHSN